MKPQPNPYLFFKPTFFIAIFSVLILGFTSCGNGSKTKPELQKPEHNPLVDSINQAAAIGDFNSAIMYVDKLEALKKSIGDTNSLIYCHFERGRFLYATNRFLEAKNQWEEALSLSEALNRLDDIAASNSNLGAVYMQQGYIKTAIEHFVQARYAMEKQGKITPNYWSNYINIGVAYMELEQYKEADSIFDKVRTGAKAGSVTFLYYLNRSKLDGLQGFEQDFYKHIDSTYKYLGAQEEIYRNALGELELDFYIQFRNTGRLKPLVEKYRKTIDSQDLSIFLLINRAALITEGKTLSSQEQILLRKNLLIKQRNHYLSVSYHDLLAALFESQNNYRSQVQEMKALSDYRDSLRKESGANTLADFAALMKRSEVKKELELLKSENALKALRIRNQTYLLVLVLLICSLLVVVFYLYYKNSRRDRDLKSAEILLKNAELQRNQMEREMLEKNLRNEENRVKEIMSNVSKIAILKKQLENFIDELENQILHKDQKGNVKKAKINIDAFFNNYADLAVLASLKEGEIGRFQQLNTQFANVLTTHELHVLMMVYNHFTSKEISILLSRSEKAIEYTRAQIRKKLEIPDELTLTEYVQAL
jgi:DNA-binding CsgD family transcriptional regulator